MRTENIEATFIMQTLDKPNFNGVIYSKDVVEKYLQECKNASIEIPNDESEFLPGGVRQEVELIYDKNGMHIKGVGIVGTEKKTEIKDNNHCWIYKG